MRLLFDQNLSPHLRNLLADLYPGSIHVRDVGLQSADDVAVWDYAALGPPEVLVNDGQRRLIRRWESYQDLMQSMFLASVQE